MKKLTSEEAARIQTRPPAYRSQIRFALISLKQGEFLLIENKDWTWKSQNPSTYCRRLEKGQTKMKFQCERVADSSGWLVKRIS